MRPAPLMILGAALAALLAAPAAWSARPLVSETADSLARGDCELETAVASTRVRGQDSTGSLDALVACGIGMGTQISGAYNRARSGGLTGQAVSLGGKTNLNVAGRTVGIVVDSVSDVLELRPDQIKPAPEFNGSVAATHITGLGTVKTGDDERMLILLEIEAMMASADMGLTDHFGD